MRFPSYLRPAIVDNSNEGITGLVVSRITASSGAHIDFTCSSENRKDAHSIRGACSRVSLLIIRQTTFIKIQTVLWLL